MKLWEPGKETIAQANSTRFIQQLNSNENVALSGMHDLYRWSIEHPQRFWRQVWNFCGIRASKSSGPVLLEESKMPGARWFPEARLNYAENLLQRRDDTVALIFWGEERERRSVSYKELFKQVAAFADALKKMGVKTGDRVAGIVPNMPEAIVAMLAASSLGAVWSSCSPDFGANGILDRFGQIEPKVLVCSDGYFFKGVPLPTLDRAKEVAAQLPSVTNTVVIPYLSASPDISKVPNAINYRDLIKAHPASSIDFAQLPFDHPLYIMFSSGTTGKPKCIVHGAGGTLLEHLKELVIHTDLKQEDRIFYQTTCGWMMWNWLVSSLAVGPTLVLYDGFPLHRDGKILIDLAEEAGVTIFGTNAKYLATLDKNGVKPRETHDLSKLRAILSTGSPLLPETFDYVYREVKSNVCLSSISGGTDIIGCFALGSPTLPVHRSELQTRSLGLAVKVFNETGTAVTGEKGELVCTAPFPSMPVSFWNDPDGARYRKAYFEHFPGVWHHGDYVELTERGGMIFYGRSDAVLNPGGVRIGTAEIYRVVEQIPEVVESIAIAQRWKDDERVVLFVRLQDGVTLDDGLRETIKKRLRFEASPHHVPKKIVQVADIPRTRSGKIVELAIRNIIHGEPVTNVGALNNPDALDNFRNLSELQKD